MVQNAKLTIKRAIVLAILVHVLTAPAWAQFVPGRIYTVDYASTHCDHGTDEYVLEIDPEGSTSVFAAMPPDGCPGLRSLAMSPDGKHLRVAALHWGAILEFDSQGNWEIVIDSSDGILPQATWNSITYDREGNFYVSGRGNVKVMRFPVDAGPGEVLAVRNNNGVILDGAWGLSVGPDGEVYVANEEQIFFIEDGVVSLFDAPFSVGSFYTSVLVDDAGFVNFTGGSLWFRYALGDASSKEIFADCDGFGQDICGSATLQLSPDRRRIYTDSYDPDFGCCGSPVILSVDPIDATVELVRASWGIGGGFAVVPLRGDLDDDGDSDLLDLEWVLACMDGPYAGVAPECELVDLNGDNGVDLFDVGSFLKAHTIYHQAD